MIYYDIEQSTEEWLQARCGKITASNFSKIMANMGKDSGKPAHDYAISIALERITENLSVNEGFSNYQMQRGIEQEPFARALYCDKYFVEVKNGGFFDCGDYGCSPDGLVGDDGLIEIKSVIASVHFENIKRQSFDPAYKWQLIGNLVLTKRDWIDFISYCADYPEHKQLFVYRLNKGDYKEEISILNNRLLDFSKLIEEKKAIILGDVVSGNSNSSSNIVVKKTVDLTINDGGF